MVWGERDEFVCLDMEYAFLIYDWGRFSEYTAGMMTDDGDLCTKMYRLYPVTV